MSPEPINMEPVGSDPLAELLGPDEVLRPRELYRATLRSELMRRPPVGPAPWQRLLPGPAPAGPVILLVLALVGMVGISLRGRGAAVSDDPPAVATAALQPERQPAEISLPNRAPDESEPAASSPERSWPRQQPAGEPDVAPPTSGAPSLAPLPAPAEQALPVPSETLPTSRPPVSPTEDEDEQAPVPTETPLPPSATPSPEPEPTGIVYDDPTPGPTVTPPLAPGRPTSRPPTPTTNP